MSSEDFDMNDSTWISADQHLNSSLSPSQDESMRSPQNLHGQEDGECLQPREERGALCSGCFCGSLNINQSLLIGCPTCRMDFISARASKPSRSACRLPVARPCPALG